MLATAFAWASLGAERVSAEVALRGVDAEVVNRVSRVSREYRRRKNETSEVIFNQHVARAPQRSATRGRECDRGGKQFARQSAESVRGDHLGASCFGSGVNHGSTAIVVSLSARTIGRV